MRARRLTTKNSVSDPIAARTASRPMDSTRPGGRSPPKRDKPLLDQLETVGIGPGLPGDGQGLGALAAELGEGGLQPKRDYGWGGGGRP